VAFDRTLKPLKARPAVKGLKQQVISQVFTTRANMSSFLAALDYALLIFRNNIKITLYNYYNFGALSLSRLGRFARGWLATRRREGSENEGGSRPTVLSAIAIDSKPAPKSPASTTIFKCQAHNTRSPPPLEGKGDRIP